MVNIAVLLGNGPIGEDALRMGPWTQYVTEKNNLYVISRISKDVHMTEHLRNFVGEHLFCSIKNEVEQLEKRSKEFFVVYNSPYLQKMYTKEEIDELQSWLGISFSYISSFDRRFYNKKKMNDVRCEKELFNYMAALINIFRDFFIRNEIKIFINSLEDRTLAVLAYYVAKRLNITVLGLLYSRFSKKGLVFCKNFSEVCIYNDNDVEWDEIESLYSKSSIANSDILDKNEKFYKISSLPQRFLDIKKVLNYKKFVKNAIDNYPYEKFYFEPFSILKEFKEGLTKFIRINTIKFFVKESDQNDKYFFYPLHYMQDAQITFREPYLDQIDLIQKISRALPTGYFLYVKPHPHYLGSDLALSDLFNLNKIKNIKLIDPKIKPLEMIKNSDGVITVNSTTGFEALIQNKPVITFGHDLYCKENLCYVIRDINELSPVLMEAINDNDLKRKTEVTKFIKNLYANTIWITGYGPTFESCGLDDVSGMNIAKALNLILMNY